MDLHRLHSLLDHGGDGRRVLVRQEIGDPHEPGRAAALVEHLRARVVVAEPPADDRPGDAAPQPANHVAAILVGAPTLGGKPVGKSRFYGANDPRRNSGLALGY